MYRIVLHGYLAQKKQGPPRTLQQAYASSPVVVLGGWAFCMSEVQVRLDRSIEADSGPRGWLSLAMIFFFFFINLQFLKK